MRIAVYFFGLSSFMFFTQSCKKEAVNAMTQKSLVWQQSGCDENFEASTLPLFAQQTIQEGMQFQFPVFNPNNGNEIVYFERSGNAGETPSLDGKLVKFNYQTSTKTTLANDVKITGVPSWNRNGWIAFETNTSHIYIVRDNGSDLTQFTTHTSFNGFNQHLSWLDGRNTLRWNYDNFATGQKYLVQKTIGQQQTDTLYTGDLGFLASSTNNVILSAKGLRISTLDLNQQPLNLQEYASSLDGMFFNGLSWHPNGNKFYISKIGSLETAGLFEVDFATGAGTRLVQYCDKELIRSISCSPNGVYLVIEKLERQQKLNENQLFYGTIIENSSIWLLNTTTLQESKLEL